MDLPEKLIPIWERMRKYLEEDMSSFSEYLKSLPPEDREIEKEACYLASLDPERRQEECLIRSGLRGKKIVS